MLSKITRGVVKQPHLVMLTGVDGVGKCLGRGTKVLMFDGSVRDVENIEIGDLLMGPDSKPRTVLTTNNGVGRLFNIKPKKGEPWVCNEHHILTVFNQYSRKKEVIDISVADWLELPYTQQRHMSLIRQRVVFEEQETELDPYFVGIYIGDGTARGSSVQVTKYDQEIVDVLDEKANEYGLIRKTTKNGLEHSLVWPVKGNEAKKNNLLIKKIKKLADQTTGRRIIPNEYLINSREKRLKLLAGLLDTDGHLIHNMYEFSTKWDNINDNVLFLARSLGLGATSREKKVKGKTYYRLFITGETDQIPCRIPRKKAAKRTINKDVSHVGFSVEEIKPGEWYGFEIDGDKRFLLGDFTITHNSSMAASAPNPIFLGPENGSGQLDVARFPSPESWSDVLQAVKELTTHEHEFKTLVIDSVDWLEPILYANVCEEAGVANIEKVDGGYGKGFSVALKKWQEFVALLSNLRAKKGMNIILIGHVEVGKHSDPTLNVEYDRYTLKLNKKAAALLREFVDSVLFAKYEVFTKRDGMKHKAVGDGARVMYTEWRPGFDAKNRFGLPFQMALSWNEYDAAVNKPVGASLEEIKADLAELVPQVLDDELRAKVIEAIKKAGDDAAKLVAIKNRVQVRLGA